MIEELEVAMKCAPTQQASLRMRAIWSLGRGAGKEATAAFCNVDHSTLLSWIHRFNKQGIDGVIDRQRLGRPRKIPPEQMKSEILPLLDNPASAAEEHWTAFKLHGHLKADCFADFFTREAEKLEERIIEGLRSFFQNSDTVASQCAIPSAFTCATAPRVS